MYLQKATSKIPHSNFTQQVRHVSEPVVHFTSLLVDLLFPPQCVGCDIVDTHLCNNCQHEIDETPIINGAKHLPLPLTAIATTGLHRGKLQALIHSLKYENRKEFAIILASRLATQALSQTWDFDCIAAIPLHHSRLKSRGYNQAQLLSEEVAKLLKLPDFSGALHRDRFVRSQVGLGREARQANVAETFRADAELVQGKRILLIDDVFTTGSTLQACARAMVTGGAEAVYGLTVTAAA